MHRIFTPRIAYCSPVNPASSGISDYSEELLPYLAQYAEVTLYVEDGLRPSNPLLARNLEVLPLRRLAREQRRRPYNALVYHMGNSPVHAGIWRAAQRLPGVVVLHEFVLHHFMLWYAANILHDIQGYVRAMEARYGADGAFIAQLMIRSRFTEAAFNFPCCEPVLAAARGLIAHSRHVAGLVAGLRPGLPTAVVPMGVPLPAASPSKASSRAQLGLPPGALILASFGHINAYKRLEPALRAFAELRREHPDARYLLIGSASPNYDLRGLVSRLGLSNAVLVTGFVDRAAWDHYVAAADICMNLRHPTGGETSASLLRLLGAGKPTLVSATGAFNELPTSVAALVDTGSAEEELILAYCRLLADRPDLAAQLGANARAFVAAEHSIERSALGYARFLARLYAWPVLRRLREKPLWELPEPALSTAPAPRQAVPEPVEGREPLVEGQHSAQRSDTQIARAAQALAELGFTEQDEAVLLAVARRIAELRG
jgi:glycosyltransferase involved in cell wall biosynthesis